MTSAIEQFSAALAQRRISAHNIIADGQLHRADIDAENGRQDAAYVLHLDGVPAGGFENHRDGLGWENWKADVGRSLSPAELEAQRSRIKVAKRKNAADREARRAEARRRANRIWREASAANGHAYLKRKGVSGIGVRQRGQSLVLPLCDGAGELHSLQFVGEDGRKLFMRDGQTRGHYLLIGEPTQTICIVEGYATGVSVHEASRNAVAVAYDCGNLEPVAAALRKKFPRSELVLCADDDYQTPGNPGLTRATEAARAVGGLLAVPDFGADRPDRATDFNDLAQQYGREAVERAVASAKTPVVLADGLEGDPTIVDRAIVRRLSNIEAKPINWLWPGRIACGKSTMIAGHPGLGKSQLALAIAATVSTGGVWPVDRVRCEAGGVILLNAEDDPADTLRPRLEAAGADLSKCEVLDAIVDSYSDNGLARTRSFNLKADLEVLDKLLQQRPETRLIVVDPITAYLAGIDSHINADVRGVLAPLGQLAARHRVAVVCISHLNKGSAVKGGPGDALLRVSGSLAFVAAARAAFIVTKDPNNPARRLFLPAKNNLARGESGLAFVVESRCLASGIETSRILWEAEAVNVTADETMASVPEDDDRTMTEEAMDLLRVVLADGKVLARDIKRRATEAGVSAKSLRRAREKLGVLALREGFGADTKSYWSLGIAPFVPQNTIPAHEETRARMDPEGTNEDAQDDSEMF